MRLAIICSLFSLAVYAGSCKATSANLDVRANRRDEGLATGTWGGQHVRVEVTDRGAELEFDCARGAIARKVMLDANGRFDVAGTFATEHAGPIRDDESSSRAVNYQGKVNGNEMELTVTDPKAKETIGSFQLKLGNEGRLMKCR